MRTLFLLGWLVAAVGCEAAIVGVKCGEGFSRCGDECVNLQRDFRNCGACGNLCRSFICFKGECESSSADAPDAAAEVRDSAAD